MKKLGLIVTVLFLGAALYAQEGAESKPYPAVHNTPSSREDAGNFAQSSIQGCLLGPAAAGNYILTDENTGEIYLLHGSDALLKQQVGHEMLLTGTASPIRPSNQRGSIGYVNPNSPEVRGTSSEGARVLEFQVRVVEVIAGKCAQQTQSQRNAMAASQAILGKTQGGKGTGQPPQPQASANPQPHIPNPQAAYPENRNPQTGAELPGASQHMSAPAEARKHSEAEAVEHGQAKPTLIGCMLAGKGGQNSHEFYLTEQNSGTRYRLNAPSAELKDHVNHVVELIGKPGEAKGLPASVAANNQPTFDVDAVQDLAPTCGAGH